MDAIADELDVQVGQNDLTERLVLMSRQYGMEPQQLLQMLQQNNQLPAMFADVRRGLTVAAVVHGATVTDTDGNEIDTAEFFGPSASRPERTATEDDEADEPATNRQRPAEATTTRRRADANPTPRPTRRPTTRSDAVSERAPSGSARRRGWLVSL